MIWLLACLCGGGYRQTLHAHCPCSVFTIDEILYTSRGLSSNGPRRIAGQDCPERAGNPYRPSKPGPVSYERGDERVFCGENWDSSSANARERAIDSNLLSVPNDYTVAEVVQTRPDTWAISARLVEGSISHEDKCEIAGFGVRIGGRGLALGASPARAQGFSFGYSGPGVSVGVNTGGYGYGGGVYAGAPVVVPGPVVAPAPVVVGPYAPVVVTRPVVVGRPFVYGPRPFYGPRYYGGPYRPGPYYYRRW